MPTGQLTLDKISDAQLSAILDIKKSNEGTFNLVSLQLITEPGPPPNAPPVPSYGPGSPWGSARGNGIWYGPGSPFGAIPPQLHPPGNLPGANQSFYTVTLAWNDMPSNFKIITQVVNALSAAN